MDNIKKIYLRDYTPPQYLVDAVNLRVELDPVATRITATLQCRANGPAKKPLVFYGEKFDVEGVEIDGRLLDEDEYSFSQGSLTIPEVPVEPFTLTTVTLVNPEANTALEGLYRSSANYCTQCEAEGFRKITCFPDRPDVLSVFTTTIIAPKNEAPVLLANGNLVDSGDLADGRHWATWHDPFPKPCYLFALVAGNLVCIRDSFTTMSGRTIDLRIYVEPRNQAKCAHAMKALKKAMRWDEEQFGREYDLDIYMIVAVDDFNMGAMENKGLNIFNSKYVLALPETATDADFAGVEGVIAHEYFHNWTGNRITCRDWFQLSLKEGLTVFRDQEFSADMGSRPVKRIQDANIIRSVQFREDAGPMAHPVRPDAFVEINNFYTVTVYNKGAELIRMQHTLLGRERFRRGMDLYFQRYDGQAVTCEDFLGCMADAGERDLHQFHRWYTQAGTPKLHISEEWHGQTYRLTLRQEYPAPPGQPDNLPFHIPVIVGLLAEEDGRPIPLEDGAVSRLLELTEAEQTFEFANLPAKPVCSLLRNFSAPVKVVFERPQSQLALLMAHDSDAFNRWDAGQQLMLRHLLARLQQREDEPDDGPDDQLIEAVKTVLLDDQEEHAFLAKMLTLPSETWIGQHLDRIDPIRVFEVRRQLQAHLGGQLREELLHRYQQLSTDDDVYRFTAKESGRRSLRNCCLQYLLSRARQGRLAPELLELGRLQYANAGNMTDRIAALAAVVQAEQGLADELLTDFYAKWQDDPLVVDKWLALQAASSLPGTLERVRALMEHPAFTLRNPNKVRALIGTFCSYNHLHFHAEDGSGYQFLGEQVLALDALNPQVAARMLTPLTLWRKFTEARGRLMKKHLEEIGENVRLSRDVREIIARSLE
ncbi:MAG: aminopeptidase N [Desulfobulbus propionicus]|nr:MAG: aminopeptidase N [Desulfobulbus propionicus]